jgi:hypothetical protein
LSKNNGEVITIGYKSVLYGNDNRDSAVILFPISAGYSNSTIEVLGLTVSVNSINANDSLKIKDQWNMTITEVEN